MWAKIDPSQAAMFGMYHRDVRVKSCKTCRKYEVPAYSVPNMPPLPTQRVTASCPFTNMGVDYFGPFASRDNKLETKFHICIFTCSAVRAVHLEKVADMSTESFIRAVRRFVARLGLPSSIISDNSRNFISANQTLRKLMDKAEAKNPDTTSYFSNSQIKWTFLPTYAPWMEGFYERLIGITKRAITKTLGLCKLNSDQWSTVLAEIEATVNSRPLTYVGDDDMTILSPNHFLSHNPIIATPMSDDGDDPDYELTTSNKDQIIAA